MLHPVWQPTTDDASNEDAFVARCLLGAGWVGASRRLSMLDLRVYAALGGLLRAQVPTAPADDPTLDRATLRTVLTSGYELADMVLADDGGTSYRRIARSLGRLSTARVVVQLAPIHDPELAMQHVVSGSSPLIGELWLATTRLDLRTPQEWGALKGTSSLRVEIGRWTARQIVGGHQPWLDLDLLRALGVGLAPRVYTGLEAWTGWKSTSDEREEVAIGLGEPARESLGVAQCPRPVDARRALDRAGERIRAVDPSYDLAQCVNRAGWAFCVRRLKGARARAQARSHAPWRSQGTAASKRQRPERAAVRAQVADSLAAARRKPV
jgi:hypothetical protein